VIVPTASTFNTQQRWRSLLSTLAFLNNCYVLRANRVGNWDNWNFYGDSFIANPDGKIVSHLDNKEELLIYDISKKDIKNSKREWKFMHIRKELKEIL
jgi:nitrilase